MFVATRSSLSLEPRQNELTLDSASGQQPVADSRYPPDKTPGILNLLQNFSVNIEDLIQVRIYQWQHGIVKANDQ